MQLFPLGQMVATPGALDELEKASINPLTLITRHVTLDPGCLDADDQASNVDALKHGSRVFSAYVYSGVKFYVITEADRSSTCILLPSEY